MTETKRSGMFAKDKLFSLDRLDQVVKLEERFIVLGAGQRADMIPFTDPKTGEVSNIQPTWLVIQTYETGMDDNLNGPVIVQTLSSAILANAGEAIPEEFPAVAFTLKVPNKQKGYNEAFVLNFDKPWTGPLPKADDVPAPPATVNGAMYDGRMWIDGKLAK